MGTDWYYFQANDSTYKVPISRYEAHLLSRVDYDLDPRDWPVLAAHRSGIYLDLDRTQLFAKGQRLHRTLVAEKDLLDYHYGFRIRSADGQTDTRGGGGRSCSLGILESGPGYCHISAADFFREGEIQWVRHRIVRDLRDMRPVEVDKYTFSATRRSHPIDLSSKFEGLLQFLEQIKAKSVRHWVSNKEID